MVIPLTPLILIQSQNVFAVMNFQALGEKKGFNQYSSRINLGVVFQLQYL